MEFKVSDIVVIKGDEDRSLWEITSIFNGLVSLKGKTKRSLMVVKDYEIELAEQSIIEMKIKERTEYVNILSKNINHWLRRNMNRVEQLENEKIFELPGSILHLDTDKDYLEQCLNLYRKLNIPAVGHTLEQKEMPLNVIDLLNSYRPDILVITGHDLYEEDKDPLDINSYSNSKYFAQTVIKAREYEKDLESLIIFAGACSSFFEALIQSGANFASSPKRIEIQALDPAIVASHIALTPIMDPIDLKTCIEDTISMYDGIGGIQTGGTLKYATFNNIKALSKDKSNSDSYKNYVDSLAFNEANSSQEYKNISVSNFGSISDNSDCMYDCVVIKGLSQANCMSYVCREGFENEKKRSNVKILIDPGHSSIGNIKKISSFDYGDKVKEYMVNFKIGQLLKNILEDYGFDVVCTKHNYNDYLSNYEREKIANDLGADLIIKLHCNRDNNEIINGAMIIVPSNDNKLSGEYGNIIIDEYCKKLGLKNIGVIKKSNLSSSSLSNIPTLLIGMGFITNENDRYLLYDSSKQLEVANAIANGINMCF